MNYELPTVWERIKDTKVSADAKAILNHIISTSDYEEEISQAENFLWYISEGATLSEIAESIYCSNHDC
jgi:hypothetical protein